MSTDPHKGVAFVDLPVEAVQQCGRGFLDPFRVEPRADVEPAIGKGIGNTHISWRELLA